MLLEHLVILKGIGHDVERGRRARLQAEQGNCWHSELYVYLFIIWSCIYLFIL